MCVKTYVHIYTHSGSFCTVCVCGMTIGLSGSTQNCSGCFEREREKGDVLFNDAVNCWDHIMLLVGECNVSMESWWNDNSMGKLEYLDINVTQCPSVHCKCHVDWPWIIPGPLWWGMGNQPSSSGCDDKEECPVVPAESRCQLSGSVAPSATDGPELASIYILFLVF